MAVCGDMGGAVYSLDLVGIKYASIPERAERVVKIALPVPQRFETIAPATPQLSEAEAHEAARTQWAFRHYQYLQDLAAWKALPLMKRLRTKKPEPPLP
jgi:hypothetical protein